MGGQTALEAAIEFPDRFAAVVTLGSSPGGFEGGATPEEMQLFGAGRRLESASPQDPDAIAELWSSLGRRPRPAGDSTPGRDRESVRAMARQAIPARLRRGPPLALEPVANGRLGELRCPVLAVAGELDISHEVKAAQRSPRARPDARAVIWPDVAHLIGMEQPERLTALVDRVPRTASSPGPDEAID